MDWRNLCKVRGEKIERCTDDGYYERKISGMEAQAIVMLTETIKGYA